MFSKILILVVLSFALTSARTGKICKNFESKTIDCHKCMCFNNEWLCEESEVSEDACVCNSNEPFRLSCNRCRCLEDGNRAACTEMACINQNKVCQNFESRTILCSPCKCFDNRWLCDNRATVANCARSTCEPNERFVQTCNNCACTKDGTTAACTRKGCR